MDHDEQEEARALYAAMPPFHQRYVTCRLAGMAKRQAWVQALGPEGSKESEPYQLERHPRVSRYLYILFGQQHDETVMSFKEMARRLTAQARAHIDDLVDLTDYQTGVDDRGDPVYQTAWAFKEAAARDPMAMGAIQELSLNKQGKPVIKMVSSLNAMKQLAELMGYEAPKRVEVSPTLAAPPDTSEVDAREAADAYRAMLGLPKA